MVGVAAGEVIRYGVDDTPGHLGAAGAVEEDGHAAPDEALEGGKLLANRCDIEHGVTWESGVRQELRGETDS